MTETRPTRFPTIGRRSLLFAAAAGACTSAARAARGVMTAMHGGSMPMAMGPAAGTAARGGGSGTTTRWPLYIPPAIALSATATLLTAQRATVNFGPASGSALAYNPRAGAAFPGPTLVAERGQTVAMTLRNRLVQESTIHWHGLVVPTAQDGQPHEAVAAGSDRSYAFAVNQRAALNFYHPHAHMLTGEQVCLGLAGGFVVRDDEERALNLPTGAYELPLLVRDANFDKAGNLIYNPRSSGFVGNTPLVNGTRDATVNVGASLYRLRLVNSANARLIRLALMWGTTAMPLYLIGNDGGLLPSMAMVGEIEFSPGERLDLLVDLRGVAVGTSLMLRDLNAGWGLLEFKLVSTIADGGFQLPSGTLSSVPPLAGPTMPTRSFSFDGMGKINGREFDMERIDFRVPALATERWRLTTSGNAPHPVHVHGASFQVLSRSGGRGRKRGLKAALTQAG